MSTDKTRKQATGTIDRKTSFGKILGFLGDVTSRSYDKISPWKYVAFAATIWLMRYFQYQDLRAQVGTTVSAGLNFTGQIARAAAPVVQSVVQSVGTLLYKDKTTNITGTSSFEQWQTGFRKP